ncbi:glycosyltransferase [Streptomyces sp. NPDC050732]|uniref:glycosyltransferase n=1 Tax=Streptomyces sp. NPDC050732 TaxID=3154632 RepID=UPI00341F063F
MAGHSLDLEIIIPARNEEERLGPTVQSLSRHMRNLPLTWALRVVDNGSSDRTLECVDRLASSGIAVTATGCSRPGKGAAVARGMLTSRATWRGFCDADLATSADALDDAVTLLRQGFDVAVGSRRCPGAHVRTRQPVLRRLGGAGFRLLSRPLAGPVADTQCGFKFFTADAARFLFRDLTAPGFVFDLELVARARASGMRIAEFPVTWDDRSGSTFRPVRHLWQTAAELRRVYETVRGLRKDGAGARRPLPSGDSGPAPARTR